NMAATLIKVGFVVWAIFITAKVEKDRIKNEWVNVRFVREVARSMAASAEVSRQTDESLESFVPSPIWVIFKHLRRPLLVFHASFLQTRPKLTLLEALRQYRKRLAHDPEGYLILDKSV